MALVHHDQGVRIYLQSVFRKALSQYLKVYQQVLHRRAQNRQLGFEKRMLQDLSVFLLAGAETGALDSTHFNC